MARSDEKAHIERLITEMTLEEKVGQLTMLSGELVQTGPAYAPVTSQAIRQGRVGSLLNLWGSERVREVQRHAVEGSRLKIPLFFCLDVLYGLRTFFPIPFGESCAFDPRLWERTARVAAQECAVEGIDLNFSPMIDVARDPRWGRTVEGPGEDPHVAARFADAKVRGFQTSDMAAEGTVAATAKHLAAYGAVQAGREYAPVDMSERQFHEVYLPPFRAAVQAGVAAIMPAFTDFNGTPMTANAAVLRDIVRRQWGFSGVMISDYSSVAELIAHGVARDKGEAAALALNAGVDIDMMGHDTYFEGLPRALERGLVRLDAIDAAVRRVLQLKAKLGLFEDPYRRCGTPSAIAAVGAQRERKELAWEAACRSLVLLKNDGDVLPLRDAPRAIAVIGPLADAKGEAAALVEASEGGEKALAIVDGLRAALPQANVAFTAGCGIERIDTAGKERARRLARESDIIVLCVGETLAMSGEAGSRGHPSLPAAQCELARIVLAQKKPVVVLLFSGRPLVLPNWLVEKADALMAAWFPGSEAGRAIGDVLSGRFNPVGRLSMSWPVDVGQIPIFFGMRPTGRPAAANDHYTSKYLDMPNEPRFAFGHGLSYSRFELSGLRVNQSKLRAGETIEVSIDVRNDGPLAGEETLFLFIRDQVSSVTRPLLELKAFEKISLAAGENGTVCFKLAAGDLAFLDHDLAPRLEAGTLEVHVGQSADADGFLSTQIELTT
ncbi:MAG: glycoside hydrolase family 3 C-terminal domain-containing protein [Hyphomicrobiales bacterium]|nr:glycoside hydrolase family 3 C-terminal domain-containing protein [Hyphomicrobiales bacterium]